MCVCVCPSHACTHSSVPAKVIMCKLCVSVCVWWGEKKKEKEKEGRGDFFLNTEGLIIMG